jgi:starch phosphorylase
LINQVLAKASDADGDLAWAGPHLLLTGGALTGDLTVAKGLAAWKEQVRAAWPSVRVVNVDTSGIGTEPSLGNIMTLRANVELGGLAPEDVCVQAVTGRVDVNEQLHDIVAVDMTFLDGSDPDGRAGHRYEVHLPLTRSGAVGYTVRVLPRNELLASPAEMGLVTTA